MADIGAPKNGWWSWVPGQARDDSVGCGAIMGITHRSRGLPSPSDAVSLSLLDRGGRREGRASTDTHGPRATNKHAAEPQDQPDRPTLPCATVLTLIRALPGDRLSCPRRQRIIAAGLASASGSQDHTISRPRHAVRPQASARCNMSRPSHSAANVRDDRDPSPAVQRNGVKIHLIWAGREAIYVFQKPLTWSSRNRPICPSGTTGQGPSVMVAVDSSSRRELRRVRNDGAELDSRGVASTKQPPRRGSVPTVVQRTHQRDGGHGATATSREERARAPLPTLRATDLAEREAIYLLQTFFTAVGGRFARWAERKA
jgi:hypothetical protein